MRTDAMSLFIYFHYEESENFQDLIILKKKIEQLWKLDHFEIWIVLKN